MPISDSRKSVAIIGAGPAGLIALDAMLREQTFGTVRVFDKSAEAGGIWAYNDLPPRPFGRDYASTENPAVKMPGYVAKKKHVEYSDSPMYAPLITNVAAKVMEFSQEPFPDDRPQIEGTDPDKLSHFRHNSSVKKWLQSLYMNKGYREHLILSTNVDSVVKNPSTQKWDLTLTTFGEKKDRIWCDSVDFVVVASGMWTRPFVPEIPGLYEFNDSELGSVIHTRGYRSPHPYRHKKVIVVGSSISAIEVIHEILGVAQLPVISSQRLNNPDRHSYLGSSPFEASNIKVCAEIALIDPQSRNVHFSNGHVEQQVDAIILATGYTPKLDHVPSLKVEGHRICDLFQHVIPVNDRSIALVGFVCGGFTFKVYEWQAVLAARLFSGRAVLPTSEVQACWVQNRMESVGAQGQFHSISPDFEGYFNTLRDLATNSGPGRKLPLFEPEWLEVFKDGAQQKLDFFNSRSE